MPLTGEIDDLDDEGLRRFKHAMTLGGVVGEWKLSGDPQPLTRSSAARSRRGSQTS
jgi:hypothetical protein